MTIGDAHDHSRGSCSGVVRVWHDEDGWGVIDSPQTPGGCWTHFSHVAMDGYRALPAGNAVALEWETASQDGFEFRAIKATPV